MIDLKEKLRRAVNASCSCGGAGPGDGCPACEVWHKMQPAFEHSNYETVSMCDYLMEQMEEARAERDRYREGLEKWVKYVDGIIPTGTPESTFHGRNLKALADATHQSLTPKEPNVCDVPGCKDGWLGGWYDGRDHGPAKRCPKCNPKEPKEGEDNG